jgi:uncharacterized membrane protein
MISNNKVDKISYSIFDKDSFLLKDLCKTFNNLSYEISDITNCYYYFSSNNNIYRKYLNNTRNYKGYILINDTKISFREILQKLDFEFTKLVIRIKTESRDHDIRINWIEFERITHISKNDLLKLFQSIKSQ